jgi:hypothetical protein
MYEMTILPSLWKFYCDQYKLDENDGVARKHFSAGVFAATSLRGQCCEKHRDEYDEKLFCESVVGLVLNTDMDMNEWGK